jgi:hypothetical protein
MNKQIGFIAPNYYCIKDMSIDITEDVKYKTINNNCLL